MSIKQRISEFWRMYPALFIGLAILLGMAAALHTHWALALPIPFFVVSKRHALYAILIALCAFAYAHFLCPSHNLPSKSEGRAHISISSLSIGSSPFHRSLLYRGVIKQFEGLGGEIASHLPFSLYQPLKEEHPLANCEYILEGTLVEKRGGRFLFKPKKGSEWKKIEGSFSLAEWRYTAKNGVRAYLKKYFSDPQTLAFITALTVGEIDERLLAYQFNRLGLQHILAISGFHFGLIALFCGLILRIFLPRKGALVCLLTLLSGYFFFLGNAPSVQRAWIALSLFILAKLFNLRISALNAVGVGLIAELLFDPNLISHLGFQLSFLATLAILLLYAPLEKLLTLLFPKKTLSATLTMPQLDQHSYLLTSLFRKTIALNCAVHLAALPALLYLFHKFPLLSLVYNLFFPFCVGICMLLLLLGIIASGFLPPLGGWIHLFNNAYTEKLLQVGAYPPASLDFVIRVKSFPFPLLIAILCALLLGGLWLNKSLKINSLQ